MTNNNVGTTISFKRSRTDSTDSVHLHINYEGGGYMIWDNIYFYSKHGATINYFAYILLTITLYITTRTYFWYKTHSYEIPPVYLLLFYPLQARVHV